MPYKNLVFPAYPENWINLSWFVKRRDHLRCVECGSTKKPLHAHHIIPLSRGGTNHPNNLQTLCENCHTEKHPHMLYEQQQQTPSTLFDHQIKINPPSTIQLSTIEIIILGILAMITLATYEILFILFLIFTR